MPLQRNIADEMIRLNFQRSKTMIWIIYFFLVYTCIFNVLAVYKWQPFVSCATTSYVVFYIALCIWNSVAAYCFWSKRMQRYFASVQKMKRAVIVYNAVVYVLLLMTTTIDAQRFGFIVVFEILFLIASVLYFMRVWTVLPIVIPTALFLVVVVQTSEKFDEVYAYIVSGNILFIAVTSLITTHIVYKNKQHSIKQKLLLQEKQLLTENLMKQLQLKNTELKHVMMHDPLTNVWNRRAFDQFMRVEVTRNEATKWTFLMLDIDYFKQYNDTYGHQKGDETLVRVASTLQAIADEANDVVVRWGGEEFMMMTSGEGHEVAHAILTRVAALAIPHEASLSAPHVTVSIGGFKTVLSAQTDIAHVYEQADQALYHAKKQGRNQMFIAQEETYV